MFTSGTESTIERELKKSEYILFVSDSRLNIVFLNTRRGCNLVPRAHSYYSSVRMSRGGTRERGWTNV